MQDFSGSHHFWRFGSAAVQCHRALLMVLEGGEVIPLGLGVGLLNMETVRMRMAY